MEVSEKEKGNRIVDAVNSMINFFCYYLCVCEFFCLMLSAHYSSSLSLSSESIPDHIVPYHRIFQQSISPDSNPEHGGVGPFP